MNIYFKNYLFMLVIMLVNLMIEWLIEKYNLG